MRSWWFCCLAFPHLQLQLGQFPLCLCFSVIFQEMAGHWREVALCVFAKIQPRWLSVEQQDIVCVSNGDTDARREAEHAGPRSDLPVEARGCPGRFTGCSGTLNCVRLRVAWLIPEENPLTCPSTHFSGLRPRLPWEHLSRRNGQESPTLPRAPVKGGHSALECRVCGM